METNLESAALVQHLPGMYRLALALCSDADDAEDLVQETCERVLRRPRHLEHDRLAPYLNRAVRNAWINGRAKRRRIRRELDLAAHASDLADPASEPIDILEAREAFAMVQQLSPPFRDALLAVDVLGLSYREAAERLDVPEGTVMSRLSRARRRITVN